MGSKGYGNKKFGKRERRAVLFLLPIAATASLIVWGAARREAISDGELEAVVQERAEAEAKNPATLFEFDPNTVTYEELRAMGFEKGTAAGIVKYRTKGKRFEIAEDFATCYGVTDSMYAELKPYISIGKQYRPQSSLRTGGRMDFAPGDRNIPEASLKSFDPNDLDASGFRTLGFSVRQSEAIIKYREMRGGFRSAAELGECYVVSAEKYAELEPYIVIAPAGEAEIAVNLTEAGGLVELNGADSLALVALKGIGAKTASAIMAYRESLGGFYCAEQLAELKFVTEANYESIRKQIWVDSCVIRKIDINFASPAELERHPYMTAKRLRRILKNRQLKGGWRTIDDMIEDNTLSADEVRILAPYLHFAPLREK